MTVLSRALIRRLVILEMKKTKLGSGLTFKNSDIISNNDDDFDFDVTKELDIDSDTMISDLPSFLDDETEEKHFDHDTDSIEDTGSMRIDRQSIISQMYDDDLDAESETEVESETEYNPGRRVMDMSREEIRKHVMSAASELAPDMSLKNNRTRAEMKYDDLVRQGREAEMADPEFMPTSELEIEDTAELPPYSQRKKLREHISKKIRQTIRRQLLK